MPDATASLIARLGLDVSDFKAGLLNAQQVTAESVSKVNDTLDSLKQVLAAGAVGEFTRTILDNAKAITTEASALGISTDTLQAWQYAVRESNGTNDQANAILTATRKKLDDLRDGTPAAVDAFAKLGLSAKDFAGLSLDQSLQKVAAAYAANSERAGAYSALQEIVGKTGKNLTDTLVDLGERGFGALIAQAAEAHAIIQGQTLADLTEAEKRVEEMKNTLVVGGSAILDFFFQAAQGAGALAAHIVEVSEGTAKWGSTSLSALNPVLSLLAGLGSSTKDWNSKLIAVLATVNPLLAGAMALGESQGQAAKAAADHAAAAKASQAALEGQRTALAASTELQATRNQLAQAQLKADNAGIPIAQQIANLQADIAQHKTAAATAGTNELQADKELILVARDETQLRQLIAKQQDDQLKSTLAQLEAGRQQLPVADQVRVVETEIAAIEATIAQKKKDHLDTTTTENLLIQKQNELEGVSAQLAQQQLKYAADLASGDAAKVAVAQAYFEIQQEQLTAAQKLAEVENLLSTGVENLTDSDKSRLEALIEQLTPLQKQQALIALNIDATQNLTAEDKTRLATLVGQTAQIDSQLAKTQQLIALNARLNGGLAGLADLNLLQVYGVTLTPAPTSDQIANASDTELAAYIAQFQSELDKLDQARTSGVDPLTGLSYTSGPTAASGEVNYSLAVAQITSAMKAIQDALSFRSGFTAAYDSGGEQGASSYFVQTGHDPLSFDATLSAMSSWVSSSSTAQQQTNSTLSSINSKFDTIINGGG